MMTIRDAEKKPTRFHVRPAREGDINNMINLIVELAVYEKSPESVKATPELLRENLFEKQFARAFVAVEGTTETPRRVVGLALYFFNFSTWTGKPGIYVRQ